MRSGDGSFTVEASLTFPLVMLATFAIVFACLFFYQRVALQFAAEQTAERAAFVWDNSAKELETGLFAIGQTDGLYWRTFQDHALDIFHWMTGRTVSGVSLPSGRSGEGLQGAEKKLNRSAGTLSTAVTGDLTYTNYLFLRKVEAKLKQIFVTPLYVWKWLKRDSVHADAASYVVEPAEFMRTVDLIRTFVQEVKDRISPGRASALFQEPSRVPPVDVKITSHAQAADYLRKLVSGIEKEFEVSAEPRRIRRVDALDATGIAHQAFYTFSESQLRNEQLPKDLELLKRGSEIKGVVWHFFKQSKKEKVTLSASFQEELRKKGVIAVIHE
ncbi:TadE family protein [Paenibacillus hamazuiensis]|uniref:TadE family protein n=1 Tax=Paenibacillus hamazuiensis TaxID=2936508 RepID=UPI002010BFC2|nr:TadE family protein [Paenibacillus hamazuiensis]